MIPANFDTTPANILTVDDDPDISIALPNILTPFFWIFVSLISMDGRSSNT
jgi:hypothetical protein